MSKDLYKSKDIYHGVSESNAIVPRYYDHIVQKHREDSDRDHSYWHPSALGQCGLKNLFDYYESQGLDLGANYYVNTRFIEIVKHGHSVHDRFQTLLGNMGVLWGKWKCSNCGYIHGEGQLLGVPRPNECESCGQVKRETVATNPDGTPRRIPNPIFKYVELTVHHPVLNIKGNTDGIIKLSETSEPECIDFKTCSKYSWESSIGKGYPVDYHVTQLNIYMWLLGLNSGYILYENRNSMQHKEFHIQRDPRVVQRVIDQVQYLNEMVANRQFPSINDPRLLTSEVVGPEAMMCIGYPGFPPCKYYHKCHPKNFQMKGGNIIYRQFIKMS